MEENTIAGIGAVALLSALGTWLLTFLTQRHQRGREDRREALDEAYRLIDMLRKDVDSMTSRMSVTRNEHRQCEVRLAKAESRIEHLEDALKRENIPFRPWTSNVTEGSDVHTHLPPDNDKPEASGS